MKLFTGNHPTGDDLATNSDFQDDQEFKESPKDRQSQNQQRHCCCVHVSNQCPNRNSQLIEGNSGGSFGGQPRNKDITESVDDGIAVRIVNNVSKVIRAFDTNINCLNIFTPYFVSN